MLFIVYLFSSLLFYLLVNAFSSSVPGLEKRNRGEFDFFGPTDYGFKCETKVYPKNEIYAATQKACFSRFSNQHKIIFGEYAYQTPESVPRDTDFLEFIKASGKIAKPMFYPILRDKVLFEENSGINPGPDRVVVNKDCDLIKILTRRTIEPKVSKFNIRWPKLQGTEPVVKVEECEKMKRYNWKEIISHSQAV